MAAIVTEATHSCRWEPEVLQADRPWLTQVGAGLYGRRVRAVAPVGSSSSTPVADSSLLHRKLPDDLLHEILARMSAYTLGRASCVCRKWKYAARSPALWRSACLKAWQVCGPIDNAKVVHQLYGGSWRRMWRQRPRLRSEGVYVSRNTYIRCGIVEWNFRNPVHQARSSQVLISGEIVGGAFGSSQVCYYRYLRFLPSGKLYYKTSPQVVKDVAKSMMSKPSKADGVLVGRASFEFNMVEAALLYPGLRPTVLRIRLRVRGTCEGANNRLDLLSLVTSGMSDTEVPGDSEDVLNMVEGWDDSETHNPDVPAVSHRRGMAPFVFVPFEEVDTDILNLPIDKMDFYIPG
eukprot:jgi/Mesen1/6132/ME000313S05262